MYLSKTFRYNWMHRFAFYPSILGLSTCTNIDHMVNHSTHLSLLAMLPESSYAPQNMRICKNALRKGSTNI